MIGNTQQMVFCIVNKPKKILKEEALLVIETRKPLGLFYCVELSKSGKEIQVGIDNLTGDALRECIAWLGN